MYRWNWESSENSQLPLQQCFKQHEENSRGKIWCDPYLIIRVLFFSCFLLQTKTTTASPSSISCRGLQICLKFTFLVWSGINIGVLNNHVTSVSLVLLHHHELAPVLCRQAQQAFNNLKHKQTFTRFVFIYLFKQGQMKTFKNCHKSIVLNRWNQDINNNDITSRLSIAFHCIMHEHTRTVHFLALPQVVALCPAEWSLGLDQVHHDPQWWVQTHEPDQSHPSQYQGFGQL